MLAASFEGLVFVCREKYCCLLWMIFFCYCVIKCFRTWRRVVNQKAGERLSQTAKLIFFIIEDCLSEIILLIAALIELLLCKGLKRSKVFEALVWFVVLVVQVNLCVWSPLGSIGSLNLFSRSFVANQGHLWVFVS